MPTTGERMKMALQYAGISVQQIAEELEVNPITASKWLTGKRNARGLVMQVWAAKTGVNEVWLRTGEVPAGATILDERARRDSNSQPSDWEFAAALVEDALFEIYFGEFARSCKPTVVSRFRRLLAVA